MTAALAPISARDAVRLPAGVQLLVVLGNGEVLHVGRLAHGWGGRIIIDGGMIRQVEVRERTGATWNLDLDDTVTRATVAALIVRRWSNHRISDATLPPEQRYLTSEQAAAVFAAETFASMSTAQAAVFVGLVREAVAWWSRREAVAWWSELTGR